MLNRNKNDMDGFNVSKTVHGMFVIFLVFGIYISTCGAMMLSNPCGNISYREPASAGSSVHIKFEPNSPNISNHVKWFIYNNGGWRESVDRGHVYNNNKMYMLPFMSTRLERLQGFYAEHVYNDSRSTCNSAQLTVVFEENVYLVLNTPKERSLRPGDNLLLNCTVVGSDEATVDWARADRNTASLGDPCGPMSSCMTLLNVTINNTGNYTCIAKYEGELEASKTVHVIVKHGTISVPEDEIGPVLDLEEVVVVITVPAGTIFLLMGVFVWAVVRRKRPGHPETTPLEENECSCNELVPIPSISTPFNDATVTLTAHVVKAGPGYAFSIDRCTITPGSHTEQFQHNRNHLPMLKY